MAYFLDICDSPVTCHAWNCDNTLLAVCPNTPDLLIYEVKDKTLNLLHTLQEHTQVISSVDWHPKTNRILTCSHDRNAYVWTPTGKDPSKWEFKKDLVILRLNRAATYARWSPDGATFVVATGTNKIRYCQFQDEYNWWITTNIGHKKPTAVTADFTPDGSKFIVSCTDRHMYVLSTKEIKDAKSKKPNNIIAAFPAQGWVNASAISPDGAWIAYTSHDSYIRFIMMNEVSEKDPPKREYNIPGLPLLALAFINDHLLIGAGYDCSPRAYLRNEDNEWEDLGLIDTPAIRGSSGPAKTGISGRTAAFGNTAGQAPKKETLHYNIILGIRVRNDSFTTCGDDGRICVWPFSAMKGAFQGKQLF